MISPNWVLSTQDGRSTLLQSQEADAHRETADVRLEAEEGYNENGSAGSEIAKSAPKETEAETSQELEPIPDNHVNEEEAINQAEEAEALPEMDTKAEEAEALPEMDTKAEALPEIDTKADGPVEAEMPDLAKAPPPSKSLSTHRQALLKANQERKEAYDAWRASLRSNISTIQKDVTDLLGQYQSSRTNNS